MSMDSHWKRHEIWHHGDRNAILSDDGEIVAQVCGLPNEKATWRADMIVVAPIMLMALESSMEAWNSGSAEDQNKMYENCQKVVRMAKGGLE